MKSWADFVSDMATNSALNQAESDTAGLEKRRNSIGGQEQGFRKFTPKTTYWNIPYFDTASDSSLSGFDDYYKKNPWVAGMDMGEESKRHDGVSINQYNSLTDSQRDAVQYLESGRAMMRKYPQFVPQLKMTPEQDNFFRNTIRYGAHEGNGYTYQPNAGNETLVSRIMVGDPTAGNVNEEQIRQVDQMMKMFNKVSGGQHGWGTPPKERFSNWADVYKEEQQGR